MSRLNKIVSPSIPVLTRAFLICDAVEFAALSAAQAIHWVLDPREEAGIEALSILLPGIGRRTLERAVARLQSRSAYPEGEKERPPILVLKKGFGRPSRFEINLPDCPFSEFRSLLQNRQIGVNGKKSQSRHIGGNEPAILAETSRHIGGFNIKNRPLEKTKRERRKEPSLLASPPGAEPNSHPAWMALNALNLIRTKCPLYRSAPYGDLALAGVAEQIYGAALIPAFKAYIKSRTPWLLEAAHPLGTFVKQASLWRVHAQSIQAEGCRKCGSTAGTQNYCGSGMCYPCHQEVNAHADLR